MITKTEKRSSASTRNRQVNQRNSNFFDPERIRSLEYTSSQRIDELITALGMDLRKGKKFYVGKCPVHGGDNKTAFNIFHTGETSIGNWRCLTHGCEKHFKPTIVGLVRGVLSQQKGWTSARQTEKEAKFADAIRFLLRFNGDCSIDDVQVNYEEIEQRRFTSQISKFFDDGAEKKCLHIEPEVYRTSVSIPCSYAVLRGYPNHIIKKYEVGYCNHKGKQMFGRSVAPVYDEEHKYIVGCTGRSIFDICPECFSYHNPAHRCPNESYRWQYSKWRNNKGFPRDRFFYNYWFSKDEIFKSKIAIIVESPGNVWRIEAANIHNSIGLFGTDLADGQRKILDRSGAQAVIIAMDNGSAGQTAAKNIYDQLKDLYHVYPIDVGLNDIGESTPDIIHKLFDPVITKATEKLIYD